MLGIGNLVRCAGIRYFSCGAPPEATDRFFNIVRVVIFVADFHDIFLFLMCLRSVLTTPLERACQSTGGHS